MGSAPLLDPKTAGLQLIESQALNALSRAGRKATWLAFIKRLEERGITLAHASAAELKAVALEHRQGTRPKEHARRLLSLVEAVVDQLQVSGQLPRGRNPATEARLGLDLDCRNDLTAFLSPAQTDALITYLEATADYSEKAQDCALIALALGAGAPPTTVAVTTVSCIKTALESGRIALHAPMQSAKRPQSWSAILLPFAQRILAGYLNTAGFTDSDALAFPGRRGQVISRVQIFRRIKSALWQSGVFADQTRLSPQTLRNSYFGQLCATGHSADAISASMGWVLGNQEQFRRMKRLWQRSINIEAVSVS